MIIGTAGHIDHGKTALVRALTGIETDRLREEKERGISIELGFAHFDLNDGSEAGVVDVPGHERFIRQMLAGAHGIDLVLLVVAADDGVMPQTEEHLDILHLLGVRDGIIVMTKVDLVEPARRAEVREEIDILLAGTSQEGSPVCEVSSVTGEGILALATMLQTRGKSFARSSRRGCFRMPIDRSFLLHGHGLVVTGTAVSGAIDPDAPVLIQPGRHEARVRSLQVHGKSVKRGEFGQRLAINLGGIDRQHAPRGAVVCDPVLDRTTDRIDAIVELRPAAKRNLPTRAGIRLYHGTAEVLGKILWFDGRRSLEPKQSALAQISLREPIAIFGGDRFVLRNETASRTLGGGIVLNPFAPRPQKADASRSRLLTALLAAGDDVSRLEILLALDPSLVVSTGQLAAAADLQPDLVRKTLKGIPSVRPLPTASNPEAYATIEKWRGLGRAVSDALDAFHRKTPSEPGMELESLRSKLAPDLPPKIFRGVIDELEREKTVVRDQSVLRLPSHEVGLSVRDRAAAGEILAVLEAGGLTPPDIAQIAADAGVTKGKRFNEIVRQLEREQRVVRVSPELYYAPSAIDRAREVIAEHVAAHGQIDAAAFRDCIQASRKFSIALLTYFDRVGFTLRIGDIRKLKKPVS